jgi:hypothetical protein
VGRLLEVGGGQSGLSALLYPQTDIVNLDMDPAYADAPVNRDHPRITFVAGHRPCRTGVSNRMWQRSFYARSLPQLGLPTYKGAERLCVRRM